jgi:hypothetical protein
MKSYLNICPGIGGGEEKPGEAALKQRRKESTFF